MTELSQSEFIESLLARCTFPDADELHCAVSGGADSLAMLVLACAASKGRFVTAHHVDHQLREGSAADALVVQQVAQRFGAEFVLHKVKVDAGSNIEANARFSRQQVLPRVAMFGHTADDQAETMIINLMRGAGPDGLGAMDCTTHPILQLRRSDTHNLCTRLGLTPVQDAMNSDSRFVRNRVRNELFPLFDDIAQRDVALVLSRQANIFSEVAKLADEHVQDVDPTDAKTLCELSDAQIKRVMRAWLRTELDLEAHPPGSAALERVLQVVRGRTPRCDVSNGVSVARTNQQLRIVTTKGD